MSCPPYGSVGQIDPVGSIGFATVSFDERGDALPAGAAKRVIATAQAISTPRLEVELGGSAIEETQRSTLGAATLIVIAAPTVVLPLSFGSVLALGRRS